MFIIFYCYMFRSFWKAIIRLCEQDTKKDYLNTTQ